MHYQSYCSTVHFRRITSIYQPTNEYIISHKTLLKHFKTLRHVSILSDHHQGALFLAKVILQLIGIISQRIAPYFIIQTLKYYKTHIEL